jgi:hypothetical protein
MAIKYNPEKEKELIEKYTKIIQIIQNKII